jgi:unsaturated rhamnogalacturonyl hydrolase
MLIEFFDSYAQGHKPYKGGAWCYEDGLIYRGLELLHKSTGDPRWLAHLERLIAPQILAGPALLGYDANEYNIDHIMSGRALLYLHQITNEARYLDTAGLLISQLDTHPRTKSGVYWHKNRYPWQIWLDGLYMAAPFQIAFGQRTGAPGLVDDALTQVSTAMDLTYVPRTKLYAHAYDEAKKQPWAEAKTGHTKAHWARSIGWLAMALVDIADLVGPQAFSDLAPRSEALFTQILDHRQPDGLWLQVIDEPDLVGNWPETSASAMFAYALQRASDLGLLDLPTQGIFDGVVSQSLQRNATGVRQMVNICEVAGLGMYQGRFRDGTSSYYISEQRVADDTKGVGPLMMAYAAHLSRSKEESQAVAS